MYIYIYICICIYVYTYIYMYILFRLVLRQCNDLQAPGRKPRSDRKRSIPDRPPHAPFPPSRRTHNKTEGGFRINPR